MAGRNKPTIYKTDFDGTERPPNAEAPAQTEEAMAEEAEKLQSIWPRPTTTQRNNT
jgi:hypothetical protein